MYFTFPCPNCEKKLKVQEESVGRKAGCPYCKSSIVVPPPPSEAEETPKEEVSTKDFEGIGIGDHRGGETEKVRALEMLTRNTAGCRLGGAVCRLWGSMARRRSTLTTTRTPMRIATSSKRRALPASYTITGMPCAAAALRDERSL